MTFIFLYLSIHMYSKLTKKQLINDINIHFLKQGKTIETNIYKISKQKLIEIMVDNDIPHIDKETLKQEIEETERYNYYIDVIYHNFYKYKNISIDVILDIQKNHNNYNSNDLNKIISDYNLKFENDILDIKVLIQDLCRVYNNYCISTNTKNTLEYKTIPDIISQLSLLSLP